MNNLSSWMEHSRVDTVYHGSCAIQSLTYEDEGGKDRLWIGTEDGRVTSYFMQDKETTHDQYRHPFSPLLAVSMSKYSSFVAKGKSKRLKNKYLSDISSHDDAIITIFTMPGEDAVMSISPATVFVHSCGGLPLVQFSPQSLYDIEPSDRASMPPPAVHISCAAWSNYPMGVGMGMGAAHESSLLFLGTSTELLYVYSLGGDTNQPVAILDTSAPSVSCAIGGRFVAAGGADGVVRLHDSSCRSQKTKTSLLSAGHTAGVTSVSFQPNDCNYLVSCGNL